VAGTKDLFCARSSSTRNSNIFREKKIRVAMVGEIQGKWEGGVWSRARNERNDGSVAKGKARLYSMGPAKSKHGKFCLRGFSCDSCDSYFPSHVLR
jgi:hypothetical protein